MRVVLGLGDGAGGGEGGGVGGGGIGAAAWMALEQDLYDIIRKYILHALGN